jgi:hypothetical protein
MAAPALAVLLPAAWEGAVEDALRGAQAGPRARALLAAFHERHLPLTPRLALGLALLEGGGRPLAAPHWGAAFARMGEVLGMPGEVGQGAFWAAAADLFPEAVAEPVLRRAAAAVGLVMLFGAAGLGPVQDAPDAWALRIEAAVGRLLGDTAAMGRGFWIDAGIALHGRAIQRLRARGTVPLPPGGGLPVRPDPVLARLLLDLDPEFPPDAAPRRREVRALVRSETLRAGQRPREGGVEGIRLTRQPEDFADATLSELVLPHDVVVVKLLEEGFLVRHRPPLREPRRDLLVLGLTDAREPGPEGRALAKAGWADAVLRLQLILARMGRIACDFACAEALEGGVRAAALGPPAPLPAGVDPMRLAGDARRRLVMRSGLLPGLVDRQAPLPPAPLPQDPAACLAVLERAALAALAPAPVQRGAAPSPPPDPGGHACVVAIRTVSRSGTEGRRAVEDPDAFRSAVLAGLAPATRAQAVVLGVAWPARVEPGAALALLPARGSAAELTIDPDAPPRAALAATLGGLSAFLIGAVLDALDAG